MGKRQFGVEVGLSDHTTSNLAATLAVGLGASAIEKHFKPSDDFHGPDSSFSLAPADFSSLARDCREAWIALGKEGFNRSSAESGSLKHRRSIYFVNNLRKVEIISADDIRVIRPGYGLSPNCFSNLVGKKVRCDVERGDPTSYDVVCQEK